MKQSGSKSWFKYRATNIEKPALSLIKSVCYPLKHKFSTEATRYGCEHEKDALTQYTIYMKKTHTNFGGSSVGLCINPEYPYFGATPDSLVDCECCGMGCVDIKCPYCARDIGLEDAGVLKRVGLHDGEMLLENHPYFYQIQMQLAITKVKYCDFVVWNSESFIRKRIYLNEAFREEKSLKAINFFKKVLLPELLGRYFTREVDSALESSDWALLKDSDEEEAMGEITTETPIEPQPPTPLYSEVISEVTDEPQPFFSGYPTTVAKYCFCRGIDDGSPMIACSNKYCTSKWFHMKCVGLDSVPAYNWCCTECDDTSDSSEDFSFFL